MPTCRKCNSQECVIVRSQPELQLIQGQEVEVGVNRECNCELCGYVWRENVPNSKDLNLTESEADQS